MTKMIPPIPTSAVMMPTPKQKIGFSIESIVGNDAQQNRVDRNHQTTTQTDLSTSTHHHSPTNKSEPSKHDIQDIINRLHNTANNLVNNHHHLNNSNTYSPPLQAALASTLSHQRLSSPESSSHNNSLKRERSVTPPNTSSHNHQIHHSPATSPLQSSTPPSSHQNFNKGPILVPGMPPTGLVRPFPVNAPPPQQHPDIKALPPYINSPEMGPPPSQHPSLLAAAQFQMAAALQAGHVLGPAAAAVAAGLPPHSPFLQQHPAMARDSYPLYPWLLSRHGRIFPHRFPGHFLLQPFRKPKRIRTAFSPSQLLKLEHAFESNQYVVGAERKQLAQSLNLSETQVKVWFQNRRTKHKRMQQEDEKGGSGDNFGRSNSCDEDEDELIDMEMDEYPSDEELDASH